MESPLTAGKPGSLWNAVSDPVSALPSLEGRCRTDVGVIGAGIMGLTTALSLAEAGANVTVLEAATVGWGASGRNNGLLAPGLKRDPWELRRLLGIERGDTLSRFAGTAPLRVKHRIAKHAIACDFRPEGWIQAAHARSALPLIRRRVEEWRALGANIEQIDADLVADQLGTSFFAGACRDRRGGSLNPLAYVRGLAEAGTKAGVQLLEHSAVTRMQRENGTWHLETNQGLLECDEVLVCTNAYNDSIDAVRGTLIPVRTAQVASAPLPDAIAEKILPGGEAASDTHRLLTSFRLTADNRLIMGGASATAGDSDEALTARLQQRAARMFPQISRIDWQYGWSGFLAVSNNYLPKIYEVAPGCRAASACNGRGIAMSTAVGELLADLLIGGNVARSPIPVEAVSRQWRYPFRRPGVAMGVLANRFIDNAERVLDRLR